MLFIFVDECGDEKFPDYFGLCLASVNSSHYSAIKQATQKILLDAGWDPKIEFKGSYLFSAKRGCDGVPIEKRVEAASKILQLTASQKNRKMKFCYLRHQSTTQRLDYLGLLPKLIDKVLIPHNMKNGKDLVGLFCDERHDMDCNDIRAAVKQVLEKRRYTLLEDVVCAQSHYETIGILFADLVGYLIARIDNISKDRELFENIPPEYYETNGKLLKFRSSVKLIGMVKDIQRYVVKIDDK